MRLARLRGEGRSQSGGVEWLAAPVSLLQVIRSFKRCTDIQYLRYKLFVVSCELRAAYLASLHAERLLYIQAEKQIQCSPAIPGLGVTRWGYAVEQHFPGGKPKQVSFTHHCQPQSEATFGSRNSLLPSPGHLIALQAV